MKSIVNHQSSLLRTKATWTFAFVFMYLSKGADKIAIMVYNSELMISLSLSSLLLSL